MAAARSWWRMRRIKHRDGVALCVLSSALLLAGQPPPGLVGIYIRYLQPVQGNLPLLALFTVLSVFAFTTTFGALLVFAGGWYFLLGRVSRGRFLVGFGVGFTSLTMASRLAYTVLIGATPLDFFLPLATTVTGLGILLGTMAHTVMAQYALLLKKHAQAAWQRWSRARRTAREAEPREPWLRPFTLR